MEGGKRKVNKSLKAWVAFVKKVQKEEKLSYKEAIHRAKVRKDKGEKWMKGGDGEMVEEEMSVSEMMPRDEQMGGRRRRRRSMSGGEGEEMEEDIDIDIDEETPEGEQMGGRRRRSRRRRRGSKRRTMRRRGSRRRY